jgi:RNA polymerase sigma-70 factor (ECF subfamily)
MALPVRDEDTFRQLVESHQQALRVHCYRMLGSLQDAEDLTQETLLRAWKSIDQFGGRASVRAWLYRIATNACLDEIERRGRRILPVMAGAPLASFSAAPPSTPPTETVWLDPLPDAWLNLADETPGPEARYEIKESIELAFVATLQLLPGRQRAILVLRDVLGWSIQEIASLLDLSVAATNSTLQRARTTLGQRGATARARMTPEVERALVQQYMGAWERADVQALVDLLKDDARLSMPPLVEWYVGASAIAEFFGWATSPTGPGPYRFVATRANGSPAFEIYAGGAAFILQVVETDADRIVAITSFMNPELFAYFGADAPPTPS